MTNRGGIPRPTLRGEIENVLKDSGAVVAASAKWISGQLGAPVKAVQTELDAMVLAGKLVTRIPRCGTVLYKSKDKNHDRWASLRGVALHAPLDPRRS